MQTRGTMLFFNHTAAPCPNVWHTWVFKDQGCRLLTGPTLAGSLRLHVRSPACATTCQAAKRFRAWMQHVYTNTTCVVGTVLANGSRCCWQSSQGQRYSRDANMVLAWICLIAKDLLTNVGIWT